MDPTLSPEELARKEAKRAANIAYLKEYRRKNKEALAAKDKARRLENLEEVKRRAKAWRESNQVDIKASARAYYEAHRSQARADRLLRLYGLTEDRYVEILVAQGLRCAICRTDDAGRPGHSFYVDHDHKTGIVRGLLCYSCNIALGHFKDSSERLLAAIEYLKTRANGLPETELAIRTSGQALGSCGLDVPCIGAREQGDRSDLESAGGETAGGCHSERLGESFLGPEPGIGTGDEGLRRPVSGGGEDDRAGDCGGKVRD